MRAQGQGQGSTSMPGPQGDPVADAELLMVLPRSGNCVPSAEIDGGHRLG